MFTSKALATHIQDFLITLDANGFGVRKVVLFGSYATGKAHKLSDIDLAIWLQKDLNKHYTQIPWLLKIVSYFHPIKPKFYNTNDTAETDPFIRIIEDEGKNILFVNEIIEVPDKVTKGNENTPYILISGSYNANSKIDLLCTLIGFKLAKLNLGIISGANTPGLLVSESFYNSLKLYAPDKIIFYRRKKIENDSKIEVTRLGSIKFYGETHSDLRKEMIKKVKAVIVIGGNKGTHDEEFIASQSNIPVIPLAITEGAAYKIWENYRDTKNSQILLESHFDKNIFEKLNDSSLPTASEAAISLLKHSLNLK